MICFIIIFTGIPRTCGFSPLKANKTPAGASSKPEATSTTTLRSQQQQEQLQDASLNDCLQLQHKLEEIQCLRGNLDKSAMLKLLSFRQEQNTKVENENLRTSEKLKLLEQAVAYNRMQKLELKLSMKLRLNAYRLRKCRKLSLKFKKMNLGKSRQKFAQKRTLLAELKHEESQILLAFKDLKRFMNSHDERGLDRILKVLSNVEKVYSWLHGKLTITERKNPTMQDDTPCE